MYYAELNEDGICYSVADLDDDLQGENLVRLKTLDASVIGKQWTGSRWKALETPEESAAVSNEDLQAQITELRAENATLKEQVSELTTVVIECFTDLDTTLSGEEFDEIEEDA